jgi:hypothetical protein
MPMQLPYIRPTMQAMAGPTSRHIEQHFISLKTIRSGNPNITQQVATKQAEQD